MLYIMLRCGREFSFPGDSYEVLKQQSLHGEISLIDNDGDRAYLAKNEIAFAKEIPQVKWQARIETAKKAEEERAAAAKAEEEAKRERDAKAKAAQLAAIEARRFGNRVKRLFKRRP